MNKVTFLNDNAEVLQMSIGGGDPGCPALGQQLGNIEGLSSFGQLVVNLQPDVGGPVVATFAGINGAVIDSIKGVC